MMQLLRQQACRQHRQRGPARSIYAIVHRAFFNDSDRTGNLIIFYAMLLPHCPIAKANLGGSTAVPMHPVHKCSTKRWHSIHLTREDGMIPCTW